MRARTIGALLVASLFLVTQWWYTERLLAQVNPFRTATLLYSLSIAICIVLICVGDIVARPDVKVITHGIGAVVSLAFAAFAAGVCYAFITAFHTPNFLALYREEVTYSGLVSLAGSLTLLLRMLWNLHVMRQFRHEESMSHEAEELVGLPA